MERRELLPVLITSLLALTASAFAATGKNMVRNGDFETARRSKLLYWTIPGGWPGKLGLAGKGLARSGKRCAELVANGTGKKACGRCYNTRALRITPGARYRVSVWAKGRGDLSIGCLEYGKRGERRLYLYPGRDKTHALTDDWREYEFFYRQQEPSAYRILPFIQVLGEGARALLDAFTMVPSPVPGYALAVRPSHTMAPVGGKVDFELTATAPDGAKTAQATVKTVAPDGKVAAREIALPVGRKTVFTFAPAPGGGTGVYRLAFALTEAGIAETFYVDVVPPETYARFAEATKKVHLTPPAHLVFVGDSLTAQRAGYNYVDKVRGWLQSKYGDGVQVSNAGVGGDNVGRVIRRLERDVVALKPTWVFIFLGHNDSKLSSVSKYTRGAVAPGSFEKIYREIVKQIQEKTKARVTVISASSSVFEITKAVSAARAKVGRAHNLFGKPEALEQYNALARKVAKERGADYLDVYKPTRDFPDKKALFTRDGVHLSDKGNRYIALWILQYLAEDPK